ncbi:ParB/RepB/Spo0J family partition protein [Parachlamydia sp. AcF125]|uniref:ParB/RepB/Spo0J family partition protein n=1 Tax=Parachlamydia sp. AcF125 TaxID=2795736 RepID=UPI001BC8E125|nr:ParB/RepB/Spo0J family partition protein [Parachlamydia sp. AcF125]MBS4169070.1 Stage 0 sporulation protein J [Parachlamydia sp. AcF125]
MNQAVGKNSQEETFYQEELVEVPLSQIQQNPFQPRRSFSQEELKDLAASIKAVGILHPPLVRLVEVNNEKKYEIISGERRCRAAQIAGLTSLKVLVRKSCERVSAQAALIENVQRVDLNPIEVAKALKSLMGEFGFSQEDLAIRIGKKRSTVSNYLRLLTLPTYIQEDVSNHVITMGHAKAILSQPDLEKQNLLYELILRDELTVREAEKASLRIQEKAKKNALVYANRDFFLEQLSEKLQRKLGTKVHIMGKGKKGRITIDYYSLDDLDRVLSFFECGETGL